MNREEIQRQTTNEKSLRFQRDGELIDIIILEWFKRVKNKNCYVPGPMVLEKALEGAREIE